MNAHIARRRDLFVGGQQRDRDYRPRATTSAVAPEIGPKVHAEPLATSLRLRPAHATASDRNRSVVLITNRLASERFADGELREERAERCDGERRSACYA